MVVTVSICSKNAGFQGRTFSGHHMTTGFGPFEFLTCGLLQRGRDHSTPKACNFFEEFSSQLTFTVL